MRVYQIVPTLKLKRAEWETPQPPSLALGGSLPHRGRSNMCYSTSTLTLIHPGCSLDVQSMRMVMVSVPCVIPQDTRCSEGSKGSKTDGVENLRETDVNSFKWGSEDCQNQKRSADPIQNEPADPNKERTRWSTNERAAVIDHRPLWRATRSELIRSRLGSRESVSCFGIVQYLQKWMKRPPEDY